MNPLDYKRRAGLMKDSYPIRFPGLIGTDISWTVIKIGPGVEGFSVGDEVFAMADNTYAELCVVKAAILATVPKGLDLIQAAAATGDDDWQPTHVRHRDQSGPDGSRPRCCWKCRAFGCIHCKTTRNDCDRGGLEEADG